MDFMTKDIAKIGIFAFISGLLTAYALDNAIFLLAWLCLIPFFIALQQTTFKKFLVVSFLFALGFALESNGWMVSGAASFTQSGLVYGLIIFLIYTIVSTLIWVLYFLILTRRKFLARYSVVLQALLLASVWTLLDILKNTFLAGQPWFSFYIGGSLANNLWAIQPVSSLGAAVLTFPVVFVNYMLALFIAQGQWKRILIPLMVVAGYLLVGAALLYQFEAQLQPSRKAFKMAIVAENLPHEVKWNQQNGNELVANLLNGAQKAVDSNAEMALWSESVLPWNYRPEDVLLQEILNISKPIGMINLIGINTKAPGNVKSLFNSVYCLSSNGQVQGHYDKSVLLGFLEKPVLGMVVPFFVENCLLLEGQNTRPLNTPFGKAGVIVCNESLTASVASKMAVEGAEFLVNPSNDSWYVKSDIASYHFFNTRLRAVETRKDVAINSNMGISGLVQASGRIASSRKAIHSFVEIVNVTPNNEKSVYVRFPYILTVLCLVFLVGFFLFGKKSVHSMKK